MRIFAEKRRFICCTCPCPKFGIGFWMAIIGLLKVKSLNLRYLLGIGSLEFGQIMVNKEKFQADLDFEENGILF